MIRNAIEYIRLLLRHKWVVFKLCCKVGIPWRGIIHDLSKFGPTEFFERVRIHEEDKISEFTVCKKQKEYLRSRLHHISKNKHHMEYWIDFRTEQFAIPVPYKYVVEMACDKMAANIVYNEKKWTNESQYEYWMEEKEISIINPKTENFLTEVFKQVKEQGIDKTYTKENFKTLYKKYYIEDKNNYIYEHNGKWAIK